MGINIKNRQEFTSLLQNRILVCDGAMGTLLQSLGYKGPTDQLNLDSGALKQITGIHLEYLKAGSNIIQTNTLGSSFFKLEHLNLSSEIDAINKNAIYAAKEAIEIYKNQATDSRPLLIAGDVGPSGELLKPYGDIDFESMVQSYQRQVESLIKYGADFILVETMIDLNEAVAAVKAARSLDGDIVIACTMSFKENGVTVMGNKAEDFGQVLIDEGCDIIGANCSVGSDSMVLITRKIRDAYPDAKLLIQPNAGLPKIMDEKTVFSETPEMMAANFKEILKYNPSIVGACCGSTPMHIERIAKLLYGNSQ